MTAPRILVVDATGAAATRVRGVAGNLGRRTEVACAVSLDEPLAQAGPWDVVVAGPGLDDREGLARLEAYAEANPMSAIVMSFARQPRVGVRQLLRIGAVDMVPSTASESTLAKILRRALDLSAARQRGPTGRASRRGKIVTIASATGGCGKTFYAVNAAWFLAHHGGGKACLVDLDLQFGEVTSSLRLKPQMTIFDASHHPAGEDADLRDHLDTYLVEHHTGFSVLAAPKDPSEADRIDPPDVLRILEAVRSKFDWVIVDTPPSLTEVVLAALDISELLFVMATLDVPSVRNLGVFLGTLEKLKVPTDAIRLVMNKAERGVGIEVDEVARLFPAGFSSVLPYAKEVSRAVNEGMPILASIPAAEVSRRLAAGLVDLLPEDARAAAERPVADPAHQPSRLARFLRRQPELAPAGGAR